MNNRRSTIYPGMELNKAIAFEDTQIIQLESNASAYNAKHSSHTQKPLSSVQQSIADFIARNCISFPEYMNHALYNPTFGFYSTGNVIFVQKKHRKAPSFLTYPVMMSPNFGRMIANQAYGMWRSMLYSKDIAPQEPFSIIEFGAGEGILARDVLSAIEHYAQQESSLGLPTHWQEFFKVVTYTIGEKSPELRHRQKKVGAKFIKAHKLHVQAADARDVTDFTTQKHNGLIISNELPDAFPVHKVWQMPDGRIKLCVTMPILTKAWIEQLHPEKQKALLQEHARISRELTTLLHTDQELAEIYHLQNNVHALEDGIVIAPQEWLSLKCAASKNKAQSMAFDDAIYWIELYFDQAFFPETYAYTQRHATFIQWLGTETHTNTIQKPIWYMNYAAQGYLASAASILEKGFIITIDYGNTSIIHHNEMRDPVDAIRMYPMHGRSSDRDVYTRPGSYDLTTSINFTDLCLVGIENELTTLFYGPQSALNESNSATAPEKIMIPFDLLNNNFAASLPAHQLEKFNHSIDESFRILIQQKNNTKSYYRLLHPSEALFPVME